MEEIYLHTDIFNGNSSSGAWPWPSPLCAATAAGCTQDNSVSSFQTNQAAQSTSAVMAGLGLVHKTLFTFCHWMPKPTLSGEGIFFILFPDNPPAPTSWVGIPGIPGSPASWLHGRGLGRPDGRQKPIAPSVLYSSLSPGSRKGPMTGTLPTLQTCLPLGSTNTHSFPIPSLRRCPPALPHHSTNGPQSSADQSCTTVETRSALPVPTSLSHS